MCPLPTSRHFENGRGEDPRDEIDEKRSSFDCIQRLQMSCTCRHEALRNVSQDSLRYMIYNQYKQWTLALKQ